MKTTSVASSLALAAAASAQDMSLCDKYTTALLMDNNATNQQTLLTLVVNTAVIGNYTKPNVGIAVPGILTPGTGEFEGVELAKYFNGMLTSTTPLQGADTATEGVSVNFLSGGGAAPLMENKPANDTTSAQYTLLTHLYSYFGYLLGCSEFSNTTMPYTGSTNMYETHKFMALDNAEVQYFITQVGLSAASFGVSDDDVATVAKALNTTFGYKNSAPAAVPSTAEPAPQSICIADDCPEAEMADASAYGAVIEPKNATTDSTGGSTSSPSGTPSGSATPSGSMPAQQTGAASTLQVSGFAAAAFGLIAYFL